MAEMPDVVAGQPVASSWGNDIRDRSAQRYADSASLALEHPLPVSGDLAWLEAEQRLQVFDGAEWLRIIDESSGPRVRQVYRFGDSINMPVGVSTQTRTYDISGFGFVATDRLMLSFRSGASNSQSQQTLITGQYLNISLLQLWFRGLDISPAGGCFFQVEMTEYVLPVAVGLPPIIP